MVRALQNRAAVAAAAAAAAGPPGWTPRERFAVQRNRSFMPPRQNMGGAGRGAPPFARDDDGFCWRIKIISFFI